MALSLSDQTPNPIKDTLENVFTNELNICLPVQKDLRLRRARKLTIKPDSTGGGVFEKQESNDSATAVLDQYLFAIGESQGQPGVTVLILDHVFQRDGPNDSGASVKSLAAMKLSPSSLPRLGEAPDFNSYTPCDPQGNPLGEQCFSFGMTLWSVSWSTTPDGSRSNAVVALHSNKPSFNSRFDIAGEELGVLDRTLRSMRSYSDHPCYIGFCIACTAIVRTAALLNDQKEKLHNVDVNLERWVKGGRFTSQGDLVHECLEIDINSEWLARHTACLNLVNELLDTLHTQLKAFEARSTTDIDSIQQHQQKNTLLREALNSLKRRTKFLTVMAEHLKDRARAQSNLILCLSSQKEELPIIDHHSKPLVERRIVESSTPREPVDNLAVVMKVVLPSTVLASFLATSVFWWVRSTVGKKRH